MRMVSKREKRMIQEYLVQFKVDIDVLGRLIVIGKNVFLVDEEVLKTAKDIEAQLKVIPYAAGVEIGMLKKRFEPSLELADVIAGYTEEKVIITEEGEKLFSYGRDVFLENIKEGKTVGEKIVMNEKNEVLGFGFFDGTMLVNVIDKGFYLRGKKGRR
ncbi:MAG: hypothetical protein HXS54_06405 [Theionarchaea archaeon]|nr:hypothetical protein [Theionarchaea archaeon]